MSISPRSLPIAGEMLWILTRCPAEPRSAQFVDDPVLNLRTWEAADRNIFFSFFLLGSCTMTRMRAGAATGVVVGRECQYTTLYVSLYCTYVSSYYVRVRQHVWSRWAEGIEGCFKFFCESAKERRCERNTYVLFFFVRTYACVVSYMCSARRWNCVSFVHTHVLFHVSIHVYVPNERRYERSTYLC